MENELRDQCADLADDARDLRRELGDEQAVSIKLRKELKKANQRYSKVCVRAGSQRRALEAIKDIAGAQVPTSESQMPYGEIYRLARDATKRTI